MPTSRWHCAALLMLLAACSSSALQPPHTVAEAGNLPSFLGHGMLPNSMASSMRRRPRAIIRDKFTIQIMSYKRPQHALHAIAHHMQAPSLHKLILIWNDDEQGRSFYSSGMAQLLELHSFPKTLEVVLSRRNDMTAKWKRRGHVLTQVVCNIDDDVGIDIRALEFAFQTWREFPRRVLGLFWGTVYKDAASGLYHFSYDASTQSPERFTMWVGRAWMASSSLLRLAENEDDDLLTRMREFLHDPDHEHKGCEDIAHNMFLSLRGVQPPVLLAGVRMDDIITWDGHKTIGFSVTEANYTGWDNYKKDCIAGLLSVCGLAKPSLPTAPVEVVQVPVPAASANAT